MSGIDAIVLARAQFAFTIGFHIINALVILSQKRLTVLVPQAILRTQPYRLSVFTCREEHARETLV